MSFQAVACFSVLFSLVFASHADIFTLKDGSALTGLFRREEGAQIIFVDAAGKEVSVEKTRIAERTESATSLMPEVFADTLSPVDFQNLMAFLLSQATTAK